MTSLGHEVSLPVWGGNTGALRADEHCSARCAGGMRPARWLGRAPELRGVPVEGTSLGARTIDLIAR